MCNCVGLGVVFFCAVPARFGMCLCGNSFEPSKGHIW